MMFRNRLVMHMRESSSIDGLGISMGGGRLNTTGTASGSTQALAYRVIDSESTSTMISILALMNRLQLLPSLKISRFVPKIALHSLNELLVSADLI